MSTSSNEQKSDRRRPSSCITRSPEAVNTPSPLGSLLDKHYSSNSNNEDGSINSRQRLSPINIDNSSLFGEGSIANSVVSTIIDGLHHSIAHWKVLLFGQLISFFIASTGAMSEELNSTCDLHIPLTQITLVGIVLMFLGAVNMREWCSGCRNNRIKKKIDISEEEEQFDCSEHNQSNNDEDDLSISIKSNIVMDDGWNREEDDEKYSTTADSRRRLSNQPRSFCFGLQTIHAPSWAYFLLALIAIEGRFFVISSFQYTSFTFINLVQALSIPSAMVFSKLLLRRKYLLTHVLGGMICIIGISFSTVSDIKEYDIEDMEPDIDSLQHIKGDILAISGAILLGLDDVLSEELVKENGGVHELLFMKWWFGVGIAVTQLVIFERESFISLFNNEGNTCSVSTQFVYLGLYVLFQVMDLASEVKFLSISEACLLNLSVLSSNLLAAIFTAITDGILPAASYYVSLILIVSGIVIYEGGPSPIGHDTPLNIKIRKDVDKTEHVANITSKVEEEVELT